MQESVAGKHIAIGIFLSMKVYLMAEGGSTRPIHIHRMKTFSSVEKLGRGMIKRFRNEEIERGYGRPTSFEDWVSSGYSIKVFEFDVDSDTSGKLLKNETLWKMILKEPALHGDVASMMLQTSR
jgi:hypothetical protein